MYMHGKKVVSNWRDFLGLHREGIAVDSEQPFLKLIPTLLKAYASSLVVAFYAAIFFRHYNTYCLHVPASYSIPMACINQSLRFMFWEILMERGSAFSAFTHSILSHFPLSKYIDVHTGHHASTWGYFM